MPHPARRLLWRFAALAPPALALACSLAPPGQDVPARREIPLDVYADRVRGAWLGRMAGAARGAPHAFASRGTVIDGAIEPWSPERLGGAYASAELALPSVFLRSLELRGPEITPLDAGRDFAAARPEGERFANPSGQPRSAAKPLLQGRIPLGRDGARARDLLLIGVLPPWSGHPVCNGDCGDCGYASGSAAIGLACPGLPLAANRLSQVFGRLTNHGDGLYAGMFSAGMMTEAVLHDDPRDAPLLIEAGLAVIPPDCATARLLRRVAAWHAESPADWRAVSRRIEEAPETREACCDASGPVNAAYVALALLAGAGDFDRTVEVATRCGRGAAGNAASAGGVLGDVLGYRRLAPRLLGEGAAPPAGTFAGADYTFDGACAATFAVARRIAAREGGGVADRGGRAILLVPVQAPAPPAGEREALFEAERERLHDIRASAPGRVLGWESRGGIPLPKPEEAAGDPPRIDLPFDLAEPGTFCVTLYLRRRPGAGSVLIRLDGQPVGWPRNLGNGRPMAVPFDLGTHELKAGLHTVGVESTDGRPFGVYALDVAPPAANPLPR